MEYLDIVNDNDQVIGNAPRPEIYEKKLTHRIVHVIVFNDTGEMALQLRSSNVKFCPLHWSTTVGGHVLAGESYEQAAKRECKEEVGIALPLKYAFKETYTKPDGTKKFLSIFTATFNGPFEVDLQEVERVEYFSKEKINDMICQGEKFHSELLYLIQHNLI